MTSFQAIKRRNPPTLLWLPEEESKVEEVNMIIKERNLILDELKDNLSKAQNKMRKFTYNGWRKVSFEVDIFVFLKLLPCCFHSSTFCPN